MKGIIIVANLPSKRNINLPTAVALLCESQYQYFQKRDLGKALASLKESIQADSAYFDSRVLMSQILMESCYSEEDGMYLENW